MSKKLKVYIIIIVLVLICVGVIYFTILKSEKKEYTASSDFTSIKEVVEYMECKYISEGQSYTTDYPISVSLVFKHLPYENETSYEKFYNQLINLIAYVTNYESFKLSDSSNSIYVAVKCNTDTKTITEILVNGSSTYFLDNKNNQTINNYVKVNNIDINVENSILTKLINNSWKSGSVNFGTKDSFFNNYDIYFDEGLEVRNISDKIYNIVFTDKYNDIILNGLKVGDDFNTIKEKLGEPNILNDSNEEILGYKTNKFYIFFMKDQISVYRLEENFDTNKFAEIVDNFQNEKNSQNLVSSLKDLWGDYDYYYNNENTIVLRYSLRGIEVKFNLTNEHGIALYSEFNGNITSDITLDKVIKKEASLPKYVYLKNKNLIYISEMERQGAKYTEEISDILSDKFMAVIKERTNNGYYLSIISRTNSYPSSELSVEVNSNIWIDNDRLAYSIRNKGIYIYNAITRETTILIQGNDEFLIKDFENNVLKYDNKSINIK